MTEEKKITVKDILAMKGRRKITMLTAYDYPLAYLIERAGIDIILVGDSLANVVLGLKSTKDVGMLEMIHHAKAVTRAVKHSLVVGDMPYESYQLNSSQTVKNAARFINEAKCDAVKIEWFDDCVGAAIKIIKAGIPVMGHIGLTPQTADKLGGFKVQGKDVDRAMELIRQAKALEEAGCFAVVLECIPDEIARIITRKIKIPTIGIGAGQYSDGQVLVTYDLLGLFKGFSPKFAKRYVDLSGHISRALESYKNEVLGNKFPLPEHSFHISAEEVKKIEKLANF